MLGEVSYSGYGLSGFEFAANGTLLYGRPSRELVIVVYWFTELLERASN